MMKSIQGEGKVRSVAPYWMSCVYEWDTASARHVKFQDRPIIRYVACSYVCFASEAAFNKFITDLTKRKYFNDCIINTYLLTYSTEQSPSWEANWFAASQEIPRILWNPKVHYCIHKCLPPVSILSQINPVHAPQPTSWRSILILSFHLLLVLPSGLFHSDFPTKTLYTPLLSHIRATCLAHLILLDLITRIIYGEEYRSYSSSLCSFLHFPVTSSLLGPNILLSTLFSNALNLSSSCIVSDKFSHP